jgi:hypothetical protein
MPNPYGGQGGYGMPNPYGGQGGYDMPNPYGGDMVMAGIGSTTLPIVELPLVGGGVAK